MNSRQSGSHTWDMIYHYHRCPKCGFINESRVDYDYRLGSYEKDLECERCHHKFTLKQETKPSLGPFFGKAQPATFDWETKKRL